MLSAVNRREFFGAAAAFHIVVGLGVRTAVGQETVQFGRPTVIELARQLAAAPFVPLEPPVPEPLRNLPFADYEEIGARDEARLFADPPSGFVVEPLHSGFIYREPVELHTVRGDQVLKVAFSPDAFVYPDVEGLPPEGPLEFAGFKGSTALNAPDHMEPFVIFAGASYFQAVARGQVFGLSARGLALRSGEADGEEFPFFKTFWLEQPADGRMVVHALLDSPSVSGAYRFTIRPGGETLIDVEATLFARAEIDRIGLAPLTSMHLFAAKDRRIYDDPRLAVHNSDGLVVWNGRNEWIWRPLHNPRRLQISAFADTGPRGFGLIQREKRFSEYEALEDRFDRRPSLWVEPIGDWGPGSVVLVEIPSDREIHDNIAAFWRPEAPLAAGSQTTLTYRLTWGWDAPLPKGMLRVTRTLTGASEREGWRRFVIDYSEPGTQGPPPLEGLEARAQTSAGVVDDIAISANVAIAGLRVTFDFNPEGEASADLRVDLLRGGKVVGEVWMYLWTN